MITTDLMRYSCISPKIIHTTNGRADDEDENDNDTIMQIVEPVTRIMQVVATKRSSHIY